MDDILGSINPCAIMDLACLVGLDIHGLNTVNHGIPLNWMKAGFRIDGVCLIWIEFYLTDRTFFGLISS